MEATSKRPAGRRRFGCEVQLANGEFPHHTEHGRTKHVHQNTYLIERCQVLPSRSDGRWSASVGQLVDECCYNSLIIGDDKVPMVQTLSIMNVTHVITHTLHPIIFQTASVKFYFGLININITAISKYIITSFVVFKYYLQKHVTIHTHTHTRGSRCHPSWVWSSAPGPICSPKCPGCSLL